MQPQLCTDTPRSDLYVLSQLYARKQAPGLSIRSFLCARLHTTSEEMVFLFVSAFVAIKLSHAGSQRVQRESYIFFTPPSTSLLSFFSIILASFFPLLVSSFIICTPIPPPLHSPPALLSSPCIAVAAGGTGDRRQPSDCFMIYRKSPSWLRLVVQASAC